MGQWHISVSSEITFTPIPHLLQRMVVLLEEEDHMGDYLLQRLAKRVFNQAV